MAHGIKLVKTLTPGNACRSGTGRVVALLLALLTGTTGVVLLRLSMGEDFGWPDGHLRQVRVFRVVLACLVGVGLATSGVALQALLRNPLAEPFILGLSTGATVGVLLLQWLSRMHEQVMASQHLGALIGAAVSMAIVYTASRRHGALDPLGLLLVGVVLSTINSAIVMFLHYVMRGPAPPVDRWIMGNLNEALPSQTVWLVATVVAVGFIVLFLVAPSMDVATFSDVEVESLGVNLVRLRLILFGVASLLAAAGVVLAGPLAFVGFICPHLARMVFGPGHRVLLCAAGMIGAILILLADVVIVGIDVQWNMGRMPIGIFTAVVGGLVFLWMLRSRMDHGLE